MSTLAEYTSPGLLIPKLQTRSAASVIRELCAVLEIEGRVEDALPFYEAVMRREELSSTATASGWALPHARVPGIPRLSFALGLATDPLSWFPNAPHRVHTVFLFAVPENEAAAYLRLVSGLAELSRAPDLLERLVAATRSESMFQTLGRVELREFRAMALKNSSS